MKRLEDRVAIITEFRPELRRIAEGRKARKEPGCAHRQRIPGRPGRGGENPQGQGHQAMGPQGRRPIKSQVQALAKTVKDSWGGIDILVNCAGGLGLPSLGRDSKKNTGTWWCTSALGTFFCCQAVIPVAGRKRGPSSTSRPGRPLQSHYGRRPVHRRQGRRRGA